MKNKSFIIKPVALFLATILMMFTLSSCGYKPEPPAENAFELVMDFAQTTVGVGETVTYHVMLQNNTHEIYTLEHASDLIHIHVTKAEDYSDADNQLLADTVLSKSEIAPLGQVEEFYEFTPDEEGTYILKAYSAFTIEGKESTKDYFYECKEMEIIVK